MESNSIDQWFYLSFTHVKQKKRIPKAVLLHSHETGQATVKCFLFLLVHCIFFLWMLTIPLLGCRFGFAVAALSWIINRPWNFNCRRLERMRTLYVVVGGAVVSFRRIR
tara:strand:+ start:92 stop:418 length:327 start_codon:yes stop_codon:yes gene_type:complete